MLMSTLIRSMSLQAR